MAVTVQERNGWLTYRVYVEGHESRESTGLRATAKNREKLDRKARTMSDLMADGAFKYLDWFPTGNLADRFRPPAPVVVPPAPPPLTIREYAERTWLPRSQPPLIRASLAKTRAKHCRCHILDAVGDVPLSDLTPAHLEDFRVALTTTKGLKVKTARDIIDSTLRALYRDARLTDYRIAFQTAQPVTTDPFVALRWKREVQPEPDPFDADERDRLAAFFWTRKRQHHALVFVLFHVGLRIAEAVGLQWGDVDLRRGRLTIRRSRTLGENNAPKTAHAARTITLQPEVVAVLRDIQPLRAAEDVYVFTTETGTALDADRFVDQHWRPALRTTGIRPRKLYATRHTFISLALMAGAKIKWLARYCGTSVEMIERHYAKWMDGDDDQLALLTTPPRKRVEAV